ncbi:TPA: hypothetical protein ACGE0N_004378 [Salmonella enterica]|nr:hypothetical protein [Salmonella enterica]EGN3807948.1 hypothetical protein [Salmonella enterica]ELL2077155.1 hypothetical protein [Salmonella enterica]
MDIGIIELRNLDYAVAAYKYYKTSSENLTKLSLEDINGDMSEIRDIIYNYESDFINEKLEKGEVFYFDKEFFLDNINSISVDYANPHYIGYDEEDNDDGYFLYSEDKVDNFIGSKIIEWIGEPEELRDTLEQATLNKSGDFYISDLIDFYKKENISLDELPKEIEEKFINGEYEKFKNEENKSNYEELKSLIESKEIASSFNASSSNSKKMRM